MFDTFKQTLKTQRNAKFILRILQELNTYPVYDWCLLNGVKMYYIFRYIGYNNQLQCLLYQSDMELSDVICTIYEKVNGPSISVELR